MDDGDGRCMVGEGWACPGLVVVERGDLRAWALADGDPGLAGPRLS
jgi:hypothetical protein